jgi:hypothetical protein
MSAPSGPPNAESCSTVIPRLKLGQMSSGSAPVKITRDTIGKFCNTTLGNAALALGISPTALKKACRKLGVTRWPPMPPNGGSASALQDSDAAEHSSEAAFQRSAPRGMCIITNEAAVAIFKARDGHRKKQDKLATRLSSEYGISTKAVRDIWNLRTWSHVTKPFWTPKDFSRRMLHSKLCTACNKDPAIASIEDACEACNASAMAVDDAARAEVTYDDAGSATIESATEGEGYVDIAYISKGAPHSLCSACGCDPAPRASNANDPSTRRLKTDAAAKTVRPTADELTAWGFRPAADFGGSWSVDSSQNPASNASASLAACDSDGSELGLFECNQDNDSVIEDGADITAHSVGNSASDGIVPGGAAPVLPFIAPDSHDESWPTPPNPGPVVIDHWEGKGSKLPAASSWHDGAEWDQHCDSFSNEMYWPALEDSAQEHEWMMDSSCEATAPEHESSIASCALEAMRGERRLHSMHRLP